MCNPNCKHNQGFHLVYNSIEELYKWKCHFSCGFSLPFSPDAFPEGVAYTKAENKPGPKLSEGGKY